MSASDNSNVQIETKDDKQTQTETMSEEAQQSDSKTQDPVVIQIEIFPEAERPTQPGKRRKNSSVTFKEKCDLVEVALNEKLKRKTEPEKPPILKSVRYYIMFLALISPFITTYSKTIINFAITDMIDLEYLERQQHKSELDSAITTMSPSTKENTTSRAYFDDDNSCPVTDAQRVRLLKDLASNNLKSRTSTGERFQWDTVVQGRLKSAYAMGHAILQIAGSRLSEIYGSHYIMSISSLLIGFSCISAPFLAATHEFFLFVDLFILGMLGSFMTPSLITLFNNWLTKSEKSLVLSLYLVSSRLGLAFSSLLCGILIEADLSWRYLFHSAGWIAIAFATCFFFCASSRPQDHSRMTSQELEYLASKNTLVKESLAREKEKGLHKTQLELEEKKKPIEGQPMGVRQEPPKSPDPKTAAPWLAILTNVPLWAFVITKFCVKLAGDTVQIELPTYLNRVMHFSSSRNGFLNMSNYVIFCIGCLTIGAMSKYVNKSPPFGMSKTTIRKLFQGISSFGVSIVLLGCAYSVCKETPTTIYLTILFFVTTFGIGGETQIPLDITERYSGTIHAIASTLAISGVIAPNLVGYFLKGHAADRNRWAGVWIGASAISAFGGIIFVLFADATVQPFDSIGEEQESPKKKENEQGIPEKREPKSTEAVNKAFEQDDDLTANTLDTAKEVEKPYRESKVI